MPVCQTANLYGLGCIHVGWFSRNWLQTTMIENVALLLYTQFSKNKKTGIYSIENNQVLAGTGDRAPVGTN